MPSCRVRARWQASARTEAGAIPQGPQIDSVKTRDRVTRMGEAGRERSLLAAAGGRRYRRQVNAGAQLEIAVADDHAVVRSGLCMLLEAEAGLIVVGETGDPAEIRPMIEETRPDVLLLDVHMRGG